MNRWATVARVGFVALAVLFLGWALVDSWPTFVEAFRLDARRLLVAVVVAVGGFVALGWSWAALHPARTAHGSLVRRFLMAQPAKYVPGGVAMPAGQIALSRTHDTSTGASMSRLVIHSALMVGSGAMLSLPAIAQRPVLVGGGVLVGCTLLAALLAVPADRVLGVGAHVISRVGRSDITPPQLDLSRKMIARAALWIVVGLAGLSVAFVIVAGASVSSVSERPGLVFGSFALAWAVGFALIPLPSGAGAREAMLALLLGGLAPIGTWIAVSLVHRVALLAAEVIGASLASVLERRHANMRSVRGGTTLL